MPTRLWVSAYAEGGRTVTSPVRRTSSASSSSGSTSTWPPLMSSTSTPTRCQS